MSSNNPNKTTARETTIFFPTEECNQNFFANVGIRITATASFETYYDTVDGVEYEIGSSAAYALRRHGIVVRESTETYETVRYAANSEIITVFQLPEDTGVHLEERTVKITTYNLTKAQHKKVVQSVYHPAKKSCENVYCRCHVESSDSACL